MPTVRRSTSWRHLPWAILAAVALGVIVSCGSDPAVPVVTVEPERPAVDPAALPALPDAVAAGLARGDAIVAWSAHAGAKLEPCGCVAGMHGGLVRRASLLTRVPRARSLRLEGGGWSGGAADYQRARAGFYLRALAVAGIDVVALGAAEVRLGADAVERIRADARHEGFVCANLRQDASNAAITAARRVERAGVVHVVTAVVPAEATGPGWSATDPAEALLAVQRAHPGARVVALADLDEAGLEQLARAVPGLALIVGGAVKGPSPVPRRVGPTAIVHVANEGKTIGWWPWGADACAFDLVGDTIPDHPAIRALIREYQEALGAMDLAIDERIAGMTALRAGGGEGGDAATYVGDDQCLSCHGAAYETHAASRHAHSFQTLVGKNYQHDPDCLRCHVTGLSLPDGYNRRIDRPHTARVSCESCHGRGSLHVAERAGSRPSTGSLAPVTPATCTRCHDGENSPHFSYPAYWTRISHE